MSPKFAQYRFIVRVALLIASVCVFLYVATKYYGVSGEFSLTYDFSERPTVITTMQPIGRALEREQMVDTGVFYQRMVGDLVYFDVYLPSAYPAVDVVLTYENANQPIVDLGLKLFDDPADFRYDWRTLQNTFIDDALMSWHSATSEEVVILSNTAEGAEVVATIDELSQKANTGSIVATYNTDVYTQSVPEGANSSGMNEFTNVYLRGDHRFVVPVTNGALDFSVDFLDSTSGLGGEVTLTVSSAGVTINEQSFQSNGISGTATANVEGLSDGVYEIHVAADDAVLLENVVVNANYVLLRSKASFASNEFIAALGKNVESSDREIVLQSNSATFTATASDSVGDISIFDEDVVMRKVGEPVVWTNPLYDAPAVVRVERGTDIQVNGYISLTPNFVFAPNAAIKPINSYFNAVRLSDPVEYIVYERYTAPQYSKTAVEAKATFSLEQVSTDNPQHLRFAISAPGLSQRPSGLIMKNISVIARKEPLTIANVYQRLLNKIR